MNKISSPSGQVVYYNSTNECIFDFVAVDKGVYKIVFTNLNVKNILKVTFTMSTGTISTLIKRTP